MDRRAPVFSTLGCRLNAYETEAMREMAAAAGLGDAVVVNTCAVTAEAVRKARQEIRRLRREHPTARLIVTGCAAQTEPESFAAMPEVDAVIGNAEKMRPETWTGLIGATEPVQVDDIMSVTETAGHLIDGFGTRSRAYVQIQNGCDHRCTFCIIPFGRGNSRSVPAGVVVEQIRRLVARGYREVVLTGVDLTSWGGDLPAAPRLGELVQRILRLVPDLPRLRLSSIDGIEADPALIDALAEPPLMPHLHLSLQAGDDLILKRMKRRHLRADAIRFCEEARRVRPDLTFGADIIAGFPTETEAMFENSLRLIEECDLTWLHVFPYSARRGTPAVRMPQVAGGAIRERAARLRAAGDAAVSRHLAAQVGRDHRILTESPRMGRTGHFAEVRFATDHPVGAIVAARVTGHAGATLLGLMHSNPAFREAPERNLAFLRERVFGTLAVNAEGGPLVSHVPYLVAADGATVDLHLARPNPILRRLPSEAVLAVTGPDGYVSPDWYGMPDQVPTWNYVAVHVRGRLDRLPQETMRDMLDRQSAEYERRLLPERPWTTSKMPPETLEKLMRVIVPCRLVVERIDATWKLSQNKPEDAARIGAAEEIGAGFGQELATLARLMRG